MARKGALFFILVIAVAACSQLIASDSDDVFTNRFEFLLNDSSIEQTKEGLTERGFHFINEVLGVYIFEYDTASSHKQMMPSEREQLLQDFQGQVIDIHQEQVVNVSFGEVEPDTASTVPISMNDWNVDLLQNDNTTTRAPKHPLLVCDPPYYDVDEGIDAAWDMGYRGQGVTVAVTDIGADIDHPELEPNVNKALSYDFTGGSRNPRPITHHSYYESIAKTNHGNAASSLVAAVHNNNMCSAGVAPEANLVVLKVIGECKNRGDDWLKIEKFNDSAVGEGLSYKPQTIDIYSNSWDAKQPFSSFGFIVKNAFKFGIRKGRHNKGSIYIFPSGEDGNIFGHSIYTITVNSVGMHGTLPKTSSRSSATLVSVYGQGSRKDTESMITAVHSSRGLCTDKFEGSSAATAIVAGIAALAIQANAELTWRDVQHIFVRSASHMNIGDEKSSFKPNAAGFYYHDYFGFGILNASKVVKLAEQWEMVSPQQSHTLSAVSKSKKDQEDNRVYHFTCEYPCFDAIEHVVIGFQLKVKVHVSMTMTLTSPNGTLSTMVKVNGNVASTGKKSVMSTHFWGEQGVGIWTVKLEANEGAISRSSLVVTLYGIASSRNPKGWHRSENLSQTQFSTLNTTTKTPQIHSNSKAASGVAKAFGVALAVLCVIILLIVIFKKYKVQLTNFMVRMWSLLNACSYDKVSDIDEHEHEDEL